MLYAFQDRENLYLVMDMLNGGDLRYHFSNKKHFSEAQTSKEFLLYFLRVFGGLPDYGTGVYSFE